MKAKRTRWTLWRRLTQVGVLLFFLGLPLTYGWPQAEVIGTLASLKLGPVSLVDPAAGLSTALAARAVSVSLLTGLLLPVLLALTLGPVFCSWVCPWGLVSELIDRLHHRWSRMAPKRPDRVRWSSLAVFMLASVLVGVPLAATLSAPRLVTVLPMEVLFLGGASAATMSLLGGLLLLELVVPRRLWCRALCPVGSVLKLLRTPRTLDVRWRAAACDPAACGTNCVATCPWGIDPRRSRTMDGCTNCGRCVEGCPSQPRPSLSLGFAPAEHIDRTRTT